MMTNPSGGEGGWGRDGFPLGQFSFFFMQFSAKFKSLGCCPLSGVGVTIIHLDAPPCVKIFMIGNCGFILY